MSAQNPRIFVDLTRFIDESRDRPVVRGYNVPVATIAYRALSGSWGLCELAAEFVLPEPNVLAALLYYAQYRERIDLQEGDFESQFDALD